MIFIYGGNFFKILAYVVYGFIRQLRSKNIGFYGCLGFVCNYGSCCLIYTTSFNILLLLLLYMLAVICLWNIAYKFQCAIFWLLNMLSHLENQRQHACDYASLIAPTD